VRGVEDTALAFGRAARETGVPYAFVGGIAVMAWGQPRATADVDALVALPPERVAAFVRALARHGLNVDARDLEDSLADGSYVTIFDDGSGFHVDVKIAARPEERAELERALDVPFRSDLLRIVSPEDTVAFKLHFGTPQDLQDARSILVRQEGRLDTARLRDFARRLGVERALDEIMGL
jgi:hypothetical protein